MKMIAIEVILKVEVRETAVIEIVVVKKQAIKVVAEKVVSLVENGQVIQVVKKVGRKKGEGIQVLLKMKTIVINNNHLQKKMKKRRNF